MQEPLAAGADGLGACPMLREPVEGRCHWCAASLPPGRRRWCSDRCASAFEKNHWWPAARRAARRRDRYACGRCGRKRADRIRLEVNHIAPALGRHSQVSCAHHLSNLETLCHECHRAVTEAQRVGRRDKPTGALAAKLREFA